VNGHAFGVPSLSFARYPRTPMNFKLFTAAIAAATLGAGLAGCGSSTAPGIVQAPGGGATAETVSPTSTTASTTTTTASTTTVKTPTSGPLATEPAVVIPTVAPSKKLVVKDLIVGTGATAEKGDSIWVNYVGKLYANGKVFDASWKDTPGKAFGPIQLGEGAVIPGWDQGLIGMKVGGRRLLVIPPSLAYGAAGQPPTIPKNATLVFVVDLLKVQK
jgi:FKBP-type peptidyl-prolyl cis-trans isomerase